jgi:predicted ArsR family transcriptional regulator
MIEQGSRAEKFAKILAFCTEFKDANDIAEHLHCTEMTSRKYMKILVDSGYVITKQKSLKFSTMRQIKRSATKLSDNQLLDLCEKYRVKFSKETVNANQARKAKAIAEKAALEAIQREGGNAGTVDPVTGARVFLLSGTQRWTSEKRKSGRHYPSGSSLSAVMLSANY